MFMDLGWFETLVISGIFVVSFFGATESFTEQKNGSFVYKTNSPSFDLMGKNSESCKNRLIVPMMWIDSRKLFQATVWDLVSLPKSMGNCRCLVLKSFEKICFFYLKHFEAVKFLWNWKTMPKDSQWCYRSGVTPPKTKMTMENPPWMKMYFLWKMVVFQCHVCVQGCNTNLDFMLPDDPLNNQALATFEFHPLVQ